MFLLNLAAELVWVGLKCVWSLSLKGLLRWPLSKSCAAASASWSQFPHTLTSGTQIFHLLLRILNFPFRRFCFCRNKTVIGPQTCKTPTMPGLGRAGFMTPGSVIGGRPNATCFPEVLGELGAVSQPEEHAWAGVCLRSCQRLQSLCVNRPTVSLGILQKLQSSRSGSGLTWNKSGWPSMSDL